jgi:hypothetical protein
MGGHVTRIGMMRNANTVWLERQKGRGHPETISLDGRVIVKLILMK